MAAGEVSILEERWTGGPDGRRQKHKMVSSRWTIWPTAHEWSSGWAGDSGRQAWPWRRGMQDGSYSPHGEADLSYTVGLTDRSCKLKPGNDFNQPSIYRFFRRVWWALLHTRWRWQSRAWADRTWVTNFWVENMGGQYSWEWDPWLQMGEIFASGDCFSREITSSQSQISCLLIFGWKFEDRLMEIPTKFDAKFGGELGATLWNHVTEDAMQPEDPADQSLPYLWLWATSARGKGDHFWEPVHRC